jgi:hypothetical protein
VAAASPPAGVPPGELQCEEDLSLPTFDCPGEGGNELKSGVKADDLRVGSAFQFAAHDVSVTGSSVKAVNRG